MFEVFQLRNAAAADVSNALQQFITQYLTVLQNAQGSAGGTFAAAYVQLQKNVVVVPEPVSNTLLISADAVLLRSTETGDRRIDAQPPQVVIQVLIADVQLTNAKEFGVETGLQSPVLFSRGLLGTPTTTNGVTNAAVPGFNFNTTAAAQQQHLPTGNVGFQGLSNLGVGRIGASGFGGFVFAASSNNFTLLVAP